MKFIEERSTGLMSVLVLRSLILLFLVGCAVSPSAAYETPSILPEVASTETKFVPTTTNNLPTFTADEQITEPQQVQDNGIDFEELNTENVDRIEDIDRISLLNAERFVWADSGESLVVSSGEKLTLFSLDKNTYVESNSIEVDQIRLLTSSREGDLLSWVDYKNGVYVADSGLQNPRFIKAYEFDVTGLALSATGDQLFVSTYNQTIDVWETANSSLLSSWKYQYWLKDLSISPDGSTLGGVYPPEFAIYLINLENGETVNELIWEDIVTSGLAEVSFSPDWSNIAWVAGGEVRLIQTESGDLGGQLLHPGEVEKISWSADGSMIAAASYKVTGDEIRPSTYLWNAGDGDLITMVDQLSPTIDISFSPNGYALGNLGSESILSIGAVRNR